MIKLAVHSLLEVVESGSKNIEVVLIRHGQPLEYMADDKVKAYVDEIEKEKEEAQKKGKKKRAEEAKK